MYIEELNEEGIESVKEHPCGNDLCEDGVLVWEEEPIEEEEVENEEEGGEVVVWDPKRVLVGAGARALFYPTLLYNVVRNKIQTEFRWWDRVDEFILLGAVPFPTDVPRLKSLGVGGVVTLNESYETLVPTSLYSDYNMDHLVIPTRDYLFAPSFDDISQAVNFIHGNACCGKITYVHCKAGRGRSTTIVLCYLIQHKNMTPEFAYSYVRSIRPRVLLASTQWQAVQDYYNRVKEVENVILVTNEIREWVEEEEEEEIAEFDDGSMVLITESDLDGYDDVDEEEIGNKKMSSELKLACKVQFASQAVVARLSCLWIRSQNEQKVSQKTSNNQLESVGGIHVY